MKSIKVVLQPSEAHTPPIQFVLSPGKEVLVGRLKTCHISLPVPTISNLHISILADGAGVVSVTDHSSNGVLINGVRLTKRVSRQISVDDVITLVRKSKSRAAIEYRLASLEVTAVAAHGPSPIGKRSRGDETETIPAAISRSRGVVIGRKCTDDYELGRKLGDGAFAIVYESRCKRTGSSASLSSVHFCHDQHTKQFRSYSRRERRCHQSYR